MLHAVLKVVGGKQDGKLIPLNTKKFLIGREQDCHLRPGSESVSRHHCAITIDDFTVRVRDLGSSNGTSINGKRIIGVHEANPGDSLRIGSLDFEIVFSKSGSPVTSGAAEKGGTSFTLDDFALEEVEPLSDTAMMVGSDTAVISTREANAAVTQEIQLPTEDRAESSSSEAETSAADSVGVAAEHDAPDENPTVTTAGEQAAPQHPSVAAPAPQQFSPQQFAPQQSPPPGYPQPANPMMPGYGQQMPQQPYPYGMPQPGMPGYGMPQQGYPYGMPGYGMQPGYGMPQPGMPGYGMQPGYGMPQPMQYPPQQMQYPTAQPPVDEYDDDEDDNDETETKSKPQEPPTYLPDPSETGAVDVVKSDGKNDTPKVEAPNPAADILKKYMGGR
jgi:pSer/pThr/pTyr-binding forkhead associated (FHA) protein